MLEHSDLILPEIIVLSAKRHSIVEHSRCCELTQPAVTYEWHLTHNRLSEMCPRFIIRHTKQPLHHFLYHICHTINCLKCVLASSFLIPLTVLNVSSLHHLSYH